MIQSISPGADRVRQWPLVGAPLSLLLRLLRIGRLQSRVIAAEESLRQATESLRQAREEVQALQERLDTLQGDLKNDWRGDLSSFRGETGHKLASFTAEFKSVLARDSRALERAIAVAAAGQARNDVPASRLSHPDFYVKFEDAFRGRWKVEERMRWYSAYLRPRFPSSNMKPVLDVGCGRGEWLNELKRSGVAAAGIDLNPAMVEVARAQGLTVTLAEAVSHLRDREGGSLGCITSFHVVEHLPFDHVLQFLEAAFHALTPGGLFVIETPNPENIAVGAFSFWYDPTHLRPLPPALLKFYVEAAGFVDVRIARFYVKHETPDRATIDEVVSPSIDGPLDYSIIANKPQ